MLRHDRPREGGDEEQGREGRREAEAEMEGEARSKPVDARDEQAPEFHGGGLPERVGRRHQGGVGPPKRLQVDASPGFLGAQHGGRVAHFGEIALGGLPESLGAVRRGSPGRVRPGWTRRPFRGCCGRRSPQPPGRRPGSSVRPSARRRASVAPSGGPPAQRSRRPGRSPRAASGGRRPSRNSCRGPGRGSGSSRRPPCR